MSTYTLPELLQRWSKGDLTVEQVAGHLLQQLLGLSQQLGEVEKPGAFRARQLEEPRPPA